jgi:hypothetical protein
VPAVSIAAVLIWPAWALAVGHALQAIHAHKPPPADLASGFGYAILGSADQAPATVVRVRHRRLASANTLTYRAHALRRPVARHRFAARSATEPLSIGAGFPGLADNGFYPADAQVAVGPSDIVEMTNTRAAVYTRTGTLRRVFQMAQILAPNDGDEMTDPQIAWDPTSQRWIAVGMDLTTDSTDVAVSDGTDPVGSWEANWWSYGSSACPDQPRLGFSSSVVIVATELFSGSCHRDITTPFGATVLVIDKAALLAGADSPAFTQYGPDPSYDNFVPVQMLAPSPVDLAASTDEGTSSAVHILESQGVPPNDTLAERDSLLIQPLEDPGVNASQRGGGLINAGDDRVNEATWANATLYLAADDQCIYPRDHYLETCVRVMEISTDGPQPTLMGENDIGWPSADAYYGALRPDSHGNAIIVFDYSGPHDWPSIGVTAALGPIIGEQGGEFADATILASGTSQTVERWGDYSAAAIDPANPDVVWTVGQVADDFGSGKPYRWATHIDAVSESSLLSPLAHEDYAGVTYRGHTTQHQTIHIRPSGGGAHLYSASVRMHLPCQGGGYDTVSFHLPNQTRQPISTSGRFHASVRYGSDRYALGYSFSINGQFSNADGVRGALRATERTRRYGRCASARVKYSASAMG